MAPSSVPRVTSRCCTSLRMTAIGATIASTTTRIGAAVVGGGHLVGERRYEGQDADPAHDEDDDEIGGPLKAPGESRCAQGEQQRAADEHRRQCCLPATRRPVRARPDVDQHQDHDRRHRHDQQHPEAVQQPRLVVEQWPALRLPHLVLPLRRPGVRVILAHAPGDSQTRTRREERSRHDGQDRGVATGVGELARGGVISVHRGGRHLSRVGGMVGCVMGCARLLRRRRLDAHVTGARRHTHRRGDLRRRGFRGDGGGDD